MKELIPTEQGIALNNLNVLNTFLSNIVPNLKILGLLSNSKQHK